LRDKEAKSFKKDDENSEWRLTYYSSSTEERFLSEAQNPASYIHSKCPDVIKQVSDVHLDIGEQSLPRF
jgi:hypothetical protein